MPAPAQVPAPEHGPEGERLEDWGLTPQRPDWAGDLRETWTPGEADAQARAETFLAERANAYAEDRDRLDRSGVSTLSPSLHFGEISPRQLWAAAPDGSGGEAFRRELLWREFCLHLLFHFPSLPEASLQPSFTHFPWRDNPADLAIWQTERTGYPIVDAAMRQLWRTGWIHNRARMIAASFLVKHLLVHWRKGELWFRDTLVDADLASNAANWQWVAGCGTDAAPFFRIFNPVLQGRKFDPDGVYARRWIPELAALPTRWIHAPWEAPPKVLTAAGVQLGADYPTPIVVHSAARQRALDAFQSIKTAGAGLR